MSLDPQRAFPGGGLRDHSAFESSLQNPHPRLETIHAALQFDELRPKRQLVDLLLQPIEPVLDSLEAGLQHLESRLESIDLLGERVEEAVHLVAQPPSGPLYNPLDVRQDHIPVELRQGRERDGLVRHAPYPTKSRDERDGLIRLDPPTRRTQ